MYERVICTRPSFGLSRPWGELKKPASTCNGLASVARASIFGLGREKTLGGLAGSLLAWDGGDVFPSEPRRHEAYPRGGAGASPQQRVLHGQPGEWRGSATAWVRTHDRKDGRVGVGWDGCSQSTKTRTRTGI